MGTYCGKCDKKFGSDDWGEVDESDQWDAKKNHYVCSPCIKSKAKDKRIKKLERENKKLKGAK